ncbi:MAG: DUF2059 domain-containing protein [Shimia sp.]
MAFLRHLTFAALVATATWTTQAAAVERDRVEAFMAVTGFDVALDSLRLGARLAPRLLGYEEEAFGEDWERLADEVFDAEGLRSDALDILVQTMDDEMLTHAADFYASDLGQRLVAAENAAHMDDSEASDEMGERLAMELIEEGSPKVQLFQDMSAAVGSIDQSIRQITEVQVRFLVAASRSGLTERSVDEEALRNLLEGRADEMRTMMQVNTVTGAAFTYRDFTVDEMEAYLAALEEPLMQRVYELMDLVTFQLQAERFEELGERMVGLYPEQEI